MDSEQPSTPSLRPKSHIRFHDISFDHFSTFLVDSQHLPKPCLERCLATEAEPEWPSGIQRCACGMDGHGFEPQTSTNACGHICQYVAQKGSAAMLTSIQSAGVTPEVNLRITQARKHAKRDLTWL